jgi:uncharacterized protein
MKTMEYKLGGSVKDVDTAKRIVTGYFTNTGTIDSDKDIFADGAFKKTIADLGPEGKKRIWHLWQHDSMQPINKPYVLKETKNGVYFETKLIDTPIASLALKLYEEGAITEHSVGFETLKSDDDTEEKVRVIKEVRMWEGSSVLWGANENTPTVSMKAANDTRIELLEKLMRNGNFEKDEIFELIIKEIDRLKAISALGAGIDHSKPPPPPVRIIGSILTKF